MPMKQTLIILFFLTTIGMGWMKAQSEEKSLVKWMTFQEALEKNKTQPKPFIIDVYTDWCGWCKHMMKTTYSDQVIAQYINTWFYPVKFNAETTDTILYQGKNYVNAGKGPRSTHELAVKLLGNQLVYPTTLFANYSNGFMLNTSGFLESNKLLPLLIYTVENIYMSTQYENFEAGFNKTFVNPSKQPMSAPWNPIQKIGDKTINEISSDNSKSQKNSKAGKTDKIKKDEATETIKKKKIIFLYTEWCNGCKVMEKAVFEDTAILKHFKKEFNLYSFNAEEKDSVKFNGKTYKNDGTNGTPFHNLAMEFTHNTLALPTCIVLDENDKIINLIPQFLDIQVFNLVLNYYGKDVYKTENWNDYFAKNKPKN